MFVTCLALSGMMAEPVQAAAKCISVRGASPQAQSAQRQVNALTAMMAKRGCFGGDSGGLFNACRDISKRLNQARSQLAGAQRGSVCRVQPTTTEASLRQRTNRPRDTTRRESVPATFTSGAKIRTMCVRLSDGYYFPSPNSGYGTAKDAELILAQCRLICATPEMDVFRLDGDDVSSGALTSLTNGKPYEELDTAQRYRVAPSSQRCDMARYHRVALKMAQAQELEKPKGKKGRKQTIITRKQETVIEPAPVETADLGSLFGDNALRGTITAVRKVRIVKPNQLAADDAILNLDLVDQPEVTRPVQ